ncbi:hypothetical protein FQZ97_905400 [compost metagenome]
MFHIHQLAGERQVGQGWTVANEVFRATQGFFQVIEVRRQFVRQRGLYGGLIAWMAHARFQRAVAEHGKGCQWCQLVIGIFFQPAYAGSLFGGLAEQRSQLRVFVFQVLADHAGVGQVEITILERRNTTQRVEFAIPGGLAERQDDFQPILQAFLGQEQTNFAHKGREWNAVDSQAHRVSLSGWRQRKQAGGAVRLSRKCSFSSSRHRLPGILALQSIRWVRRPLACPCPPPWHWLGRVGSRAFAARPGIGWARVACAGIARRARMPGEPGLAGSVAVPGGQGC